MRIVNRLEELRSALAGLRGPDLNEAASIALVPTMGALHEGHLTLVREAARMADHVVASIFVNPTQFGPNEDLAAYPRRLAEDARLLEGEGVTLLWAPTVAEVYPEGFATSIAVSGVSAGFCGGTRPGHFDGVATVVCKLFNQVQPDVALFGEKDWQQLAVIRRMARDLDLTRPHAGAIIGVPTVREADGLAMSSRNQYLTSAQRAVAAALPDAMREAVTAIENGTAVNQALARLQSQLLGAGFASVDYATLADAQSLQLLDCKPAGRPGRLLVAVRIGTTRLIDNMAVEGS